MNIYKKNYKLAKSNIHGTGLFSNYFFKKNDIIGIAITFSYAIYPNVTDDLGKWINHSYNPNSFIYYDSNKYVYFLVAGKDIYENTEITMDYRNTPWYIQKPGLNYK